MAKTAQHDEGHGPFGRWLVAQRRARGWTQVALAERLGYDKSVVAGWEQGRRLPLRRQVAELVQLFGATGASGREWYWRAGYVPPDLWGLIDGLPREAVVALSIQRPARRQEVG